VHFFFILLLVTYVSCIKNNEEPNVVVRVGETALTEEALSNSAVFTPEARASYINNWINTELLFQAGGSVGLDKDLVIEEQISLYSKKIIGQSFLDTKIQSAVSVTKEEIRNYYKKNKESFKRLKAEAVINGFVVESKKEANRVRANLEKSSNNKKRNEMFDKYDVVAETVSNGNLNHKINKKVFGASKNKYIGPIDLGGNYSVVEVVKRYDKGTYLGLDSVYDKIYLLIYKRKAAIQTQAIIDSLKQERLIGLNIKNT